MRTQGQERFTGQSDWKANRVGSSTQLLMDAIAKERAVPETKYGVESTAVIGIAISLGAFIGWVVYEAVVYGL